MNSASRRLSETVEELARCNQLLDVLMDELRDLLGEPLDAENARSISRLVDAMLDNLDRQAELEDHGEYLKDVFERFPTWHPHWEQLREQHQLLHRQLRGTRGRLDHVASLQVGREVRRELKDWLETYQELRRRESNLIHEAFVLDVGEGE